VGESDWVTTPEALRPPDVEGRGGSRAGSDGRERVDVERVRGISCISGIVGDVGDVGDPRGLSYITGRRLSDDTLLLKRPPSTDHLLLRRSGRLAMLGPPSEERPSSNEGLSGVSSSVTVKDGVAPIMIASCGRIDPAGGRSGALLSKRA
jgi:hypothetical protein